MDRAAVAGDRTKWLMANQSIRRVLMVGTHIGLVDEADRYLERALRDSGVKLRVFDILASAFTPLTLRRLIPSRLKQMISPRRLPAVDRTNTRLRNERFVRVVEQFRPDLVIALRAERLDAASLRQAKALGAVLVNWIADVPETFIPEELVPIYDLWLVFDRSHRAWLLERGAKRVEYLPLACDPHDHYPLTLTPAERTRWASRLCFVGAYTPRREELFRAVADLGLAIWGPRWGQAQSSAVKACVRSAEYLRREGWLRAYAGTELVISIQSQAQHGLSNRLWEALAARCCVVAEWTPALDETLQRVVMTFRTPEEFRRVCEELLRTPQQRAALAKHGYELVLTEHTYANRAQTIVQLVMELRQTLRCTPSSSQSRSG